MLGWIMGIATLIQSIVAALKLILPSSKKHDCDKSDDKPE